MFFLFLFSSILGEISMENINPNDIHLKLNQILKTKKRILQQHHWELLR